MKKEFLDFKQNADQAALLLKSISNPNRLMVLCKLVEKERSVNELLQHLNISQSALSQNLIKMKSDGILGSKSLGAKNIYYIDNKIVKDIFKVLYKNFCGDKK